MNNNRNANDPLAYLLNVETWQIEHPEASRILDRVSRASARTGDRVRLVFRAPANTMGERITVTICECVPGEVYIGKLQSPTLTLPLTGGTWVRFGPEHILEIVNQ
jgi:hypothetical protein